MENKKAIIILTIVLAAALAIVSFFGAFDTATYERDAPSLAAQGAGQDFVDLVIVVPLLILSLVFVPRKSRAALFILAGAVFYILYSFCIYAFGIHFNTFFLLYCLILGSSLYLFILVILELIRMNVQNGFSEKAPIRLTATYLILIAGLFYVLWFKDIIPAILNNTIPKAVSDYDLLVNPVHVLDMAVALPGLVLTAVLLMKKRRLGFILAPIVLVFIILLAIALAAMVFVSQARGFTEDPSIAYIFVVMAAISTVFLYLFLKSITASKKDIA